MLFNKGAVDSLFLKHPNITFSNSHLSTKDHLLIRTVTLIRKNHTISIIDVVLIPWMKDHPKRDEYFQSISVYACLARSIFMLRFFSLYCKKCRRHLIRHALKSTNHRWLRANLCAIPTLADMKLVELIIWKLSKSIFCVKQAFLI